MLMACQAWRGHDGWGASWDGICQLQTCGDLGRSPEGRASAEADAGIQVSTLLQGTSEWHASGRTVGKG